MCVTRPKNHFENWNFLFTYLKNRQSLFTEFIDGLIWLKEKRKPIWKFNEASLKMINVLPSWSFLLIKLTYYKDYDITTSVCLIQKT